MLPIAGVGGNDHWCSDVIASAGLAALFSVLFIRIFRLQPAQTGTNGPSSRLTKSDAIG
jgi:hypothetical protein